MTFTLASYNLLADSYMNPAWYPATEPHLLDPAHRHPVLVDRIARLDADVICLQEVESDVFWLIEERLAALAYEGKYASKGGGKPDGCATFVRVASMKIRGVHTLYYADGSGSQPSSGHVALVTVVEHEGQQIGIANTHLKWDPPGTPPASQIGLRRCAELLDARGGLAPGCSSWILCGDMNVTPDSAVVQLVLAAGFLDAYADKPLAFTCNANRNARRLDYLFHSSDLVAEAVDLPVIDIDTPLPSEEQPSDHLVISAKIHRVT